MKEISKYLIRFINTEFLNKPSIVTNFNNTNEFSTISIEFLQKIYQHILNADIKWIHNKDNIKETIINCNNELPKGSFYDNISPEIKPLIEHLPKICRRYSFKIPNCYEIENNYQSDNKCYYIKVLTILREQHRCS